MSNLFKKVLNEIYNSPRGYTGIILILVVLTIFILNNVFLVWLVLGICYILALKEAIRLYGIDSKPYLYAMGILVWIISFNYDKSSIYITLVCLMIIISYNIYYQQDNKDYSVILYPTIPFLCMFDIYKFDIKAAIWLIVTIAIADIAAYFGGKMFGKSQLSPISPNKTLEGALIGLVFAVVIGTIIGFFIKGYIYSFFITLCITIASIFGDLYESSLKRKANVKDSGNILPGHGGILDRVDGLLFASVVMIFLL